MAEVVVFAGPCLPRRPDASWRRLLDGVDVRGPVRRGDVFSALGSGAKTLVLLDGYYYDVLAVTHKEVLYALEAGTRVVGAASMGALRAAELEAFGMAGVGRIFEWYRDGVIDGDDEVAVLHTSAAEGYRTLTVATVELRHALAPLVEGGEVAAETAAEIVRRVRELPFGERHPDAVEVHARDLIGVAAELLMERLAEPGLKREDARRALEAVLRPEEGEGSPSRRRPEPGWDTIFLGHFQEWHLAARPAGDSAVTCREAWHLVQLLHDGAARFVRGLRRRFLLAAAASEAGLEPPPERVDELRRSLEGHLVRELGGTVLPPPEISAEAGDQALAEAACRHYGGAAAALAALARRWGAEPPENECEALLLDLVERQHDLMPQWNLVRGFVASSIFAAARAAAEAAKPIAEAFRAKTRGARIVEEDLDLLAAELWGCSLDEVEAEARRRGLYKVSDFSPGFRDALELAAPAERLLARPVNDYPERRAALVSESLEAFFDLSADVDSLSLPR